MTLAGADVVSNWLESSWAAARNETLGGTLQKLIEGSPVGPEFAMIGAAIKGATNLSKAAKGAHAVVGAATKGPIWSSTKKLSSVENALGHWNKHKAEFPELANSKQYVEAARSLVTNPPAGALTKARGAETLVYDRATNTFAVRGADGVPKTMFRPTDGINYWNKQ
jgi:filamentous hemagglutinin